MWSSFSSAFLTYFNAAMEQKQNKNVTQINPAPPTALPEGLLDFKKSSGLGEPPKLSPIVTRGP